MHVEPGERERLREATAILLAGGLTNAVLGAGKVLVGTFTGYLPMTASGVHSLSDIASDIVAWVAVLLGAQSGKGEDLRFHYGRRRIETLLSLFAAFLIAYVSVELIMDALGYHRHGHGASTAIVEDAGLDAEGPGDDHDHDEEGVEHFSLLIAGTILVSVIAKETLFHVTRRKGVRLNSPMLVAKAWHHRADSISSLAVLVSLLISTFFPSLELVDQVTTVIIASLILHSAWEVGSSAVKELIDFAPSLETLALVEEMAERVEEVTFTHNIRIRSMGGALYVELTAETDPALTVAEGHAVTGRIRQRIMERVPDVIGVSTQLAPRGEYLRNFLGSGNDEEE